MWESEPAPGGMQLKVRDVERGMALVALDDGKDSVAIGLLPHERQDAARAVAGPEYLVVSRAEVETLQGDVDRLRERLSRTGPFEYEQPLYDRTEEDQAKAAGLGKIGL